MPDGEVRLYLIKFGSVTAYFTDDGEGGSALVVEPSPDALLPGDPVPEIRAALLAKAAELCHCPVDAIERRPIDYLCSKMTAATEKPRHPWQQPRARAVSKPFRR